MTPQDIFDRVCDHLAEQKGRAIAGDGFCQYRAPNGLKCAVGALIPDHLYDPRMDAPYDVGDEPWDYGGGVMSIANGIRDGVYSPELRWIIEQEMLLSDLQSVHDVSDNWESSGAMRGALANVARMHDLNADKIEPTVNAIFGA